MGLTDAYRNDGDVRHFVGMLDGLAYLRLMDMEIGITYLQGIIPHHVPGMQDLFIYFDQTYVRGTFARQRSNNVVVDNIINLRRHPPLFPPELWNMHDLSIFNEGRTNNACEGWNNAYCQLVGHPNPSIWQAIKAFQLDSVANKTKIVFLENGQPPRKKTKRATEQHQRRVHQLCEDLQNGRRTVVETLRAIGHTVVLSRGQF